ncbi:MAG TPA: MFS transporter [Bacteroidales bacterium]|nr:MFS transporter [Bacteroidales bacterium]
MVRFKVKGTPLRGLLGATLGFFFGFAAVSLYGPSATRLKDAMDLSPALVGLLVAIPSLTGSLLRIPFGAWVDVTGGRKPFLILLGLSMLGLGGITILLNVTYPDDMHGLFPLVIFFGMLSGCGIATFSVGVGQTSYWFPRKNQGMALGTYAGLGNLAPGIFSLILPLYLQHFGFISAYFAWFIFLVTGAVVYYFIGVNSYYFQYKKTGRSIQESVEKSKELGQELFPSGDIKTSLVRSVKSFNTWKLILLYFTTFGGFIALTAWFPVYWTEFHGFNPLTAGLYTAIFSILASLIRVTGGTISDRMGGERTSLISLVTVLFASVLMIYADTHWLNFTATIILAAGMGVNNAAVFKLMPQYVPEAIGGAAGWIGGLGAFGGFVFPPLLGDIVSFSGTKGYAEGFIIFSILSALCILVLLLKKKTKPD